MFIMIVYEDSAPPPKLFLGGLWWRAKAEGENFVWVCLVIDYLVGLHWFLLTANAIPVDSFEERV